MSSSATPSPTPQTDETDKPPDFTIPEQVKPDPPKYDIPKTIKRPEAEPDYSKQTEEDTKKYRSYEEEQQHQIQRFHELEDKYYEQSKPLLQSVTDQTAQLDSAPPNIQADPELQKQIQAYQQKNQGNGVSEIFKMLMLGMGLAFSVAGWRRGWGARAGIMEGWGNAFKAMAQGKKDAAKEQADNAYRISELTRQENAERHQQLMEIYQNRRLNLEQKKELFNETQKLYGMDATHLRTENNETNQQLKVLQNQIKVDRDLAKLQIASHHNINNLLFNDPVGKRYRTYIMSMTADPNGPTKGRMVDPGRSQPELVESQQILSYSDWLDFDRKKSKADESGKLPEVPKGKTPGEQTPQDKVNSWLKKYFPGGQ